MNPEEMEKLYKDRLESLKAEYAVEKLILEHDLEMRRAKLYKLYEDLWCHPEGQEIFQNYCQHLLKDTEKNARKITELDEFLASKSE